MSQYTAYVKGLSPYNKRSLRVVEDCRGLVFGAIVGVRLAKTVVDLTMIGAIMLILNLSTP